MRSTYNRENPQKDIKIVEDGRIKKEQNVKKDIKMDFNSEEKKKMRRIKKEVKREHEKALKSVKKEKMEKDEDRKKSIIPLTDPSIPSPWRVYLSMRKMRCYYHNHDTRKSYWEREEVEKWIREHKVSVVNCNDDMINFDQDDITCIKAIRCESGPLDVPSPSVPRKSGHLNLSTHSIAVFDTSALIDLPEILDITVRNNVICVIPYKVVQELDGLKKSTRCRVAHPAAVVHQFLDDLSGNNNPILILESARELNEPLEGFVVENADDKILKCALKIMEFMGDHMRNIWFVTNDRNLRLKTRGFIGTQNSKLQAVGSQVFVNELVKERSEKKKESREKKKEEKNEVKRKEKEKDQEEEVIWDEFGDEEDSDDDIVEVNVPRVEIPDEVWDEYMRPSQVFFEILSKTPSAIYSIYGNISLNFFIRDKAYKDLHSIREGILNISNSWKEDTFMRFCNSLHSLHRYWIVRSPFPPQKLSQKALTDDLSLVGIDKVRESISDAFQMIQSFSSVEDGHRFQLL
ncbi:hypothetical protein PENTCL1PPCAC_6836 [Pristionchus entomophagus]|uniref:WW domain-containing protein n=1 Tax=Pristionchus entomophagus TaxID=358040 RepID=A0AAV5SN69_9BILA|nr:hypothetical protein PENTCL1PPCAC_6836 [Pristionchus entomophagus]